MLLMVTPSSLFFTGVGIILLTHTLIEVSSFVMDICLCLDEIYMSFVLETLNYMLYICKPFFKD